MKKFLIVIILFLLSGTIWADVNSLKENNINIKKEMVEIGEPYVNGPTSSPPSREEINKIKNGNKTFWELNSFIAIFLIILFLLIIYLFFKTKKRKAKKSK